jgi:hypothetical protein
VFRCDDGGVVRANLVDRAQNMLERNKVIRNEKENTLFAVSPFLAILSAPTTENFEK